MPSLFPSLVTVLTLLTSAVLGVDIGFALAGIIEDVTVTAPDEFNSGGSIAVNNVNVTVPKNLQVGVPAANWIAWRTFAAAAQNGTFDGFELSVVGNTIPDIGAVAAQVYVTRVPTQASDGFISEINTDGTMKITSGSAIGTIRISDPNALYSAGYTDSPLVTASEKSPSITSVSGFPMCVPRSVNDKLCPSWNRPNITETGTKQGTLTAPDPLVMAPFVVGDFIRYSGVKNTDNEIVCHSIVATNIQIITPDGYPTYIRPETVSMGVFTAVNDTAPAEGFYAGHTSAPGVSTVLFSGIGTDACTGLLILNPLQSAEADSTGKFAATYLSTKDHAYSREYLLSTQNRDTFTLNGIMAGRYTQPVMEWIQPQMAASGSEPLANDFASFKYLTDGLGPDAEGNMWGPLDPFPQSGVKTFDPLTGCATRTAYLGTTDA